MNFTDGLDSMDMDTRVHRKLERSKPTIGARVVNTKIWFVIKITVAISCVVSSIAVALGIECRDQSLTVKWILTSVVMLAFVFAMADLILVKRALFHMGIENGRISDNVDQLDGYNKYYQLQLRQSNDILIERKRKITIQKTQITKLADEINKLQGVNAYLEKLLQEAKVHNEENAKKYDAQTTQLRIVEENLFGMRMENATLKRSLEKRARAESTDPADSAESY